MLSTKVTPISFFILLLAMTHFKILLLIIIPIEAVDSASIDRCPNRCGGVNITFPFGIGSGCYLPGFQVLCDDHDAPVLADLNPNLPLIAISQGQVRVSSTPAVAASCFISNSPGDNSNSIDAESTLSMSTEGPFTIPFTSTYLVAIGCGVFMGVGGSNETSSASACISVCKDEHDPVDGYCAGTGCCTTNLPPLTKSLEIGILRAIRTGFEWTSNCRYGFLVEEGGYSFKRSDIEDFMSRAAAETISMRLEWAVGGAGGKCSQAVGSAGYLCGNNSLCEDSERGAGGYLCSCSNGFKGNAYLSDGCRDIDECSEDYGSNPCVKEATCQNEVPFFKCLCPNGSIGDGRSDGTKCVKKFPLIRVIAGAIAFFGGIILILCWGLWALKKRKLIKLRAKYFEKNGGILLEKHLSSRSELAKYTRIYSSEELKRATNNYNSNRLLGSGSHGKVYKGILENGTIVAIKKSQILAESQVDQFVNEVFILTQINHKNVVRLLGCCLETEVPLLVYEFISNGSLYQLIHDTDHSTTNISWRIRCRIAIEIAEALSYLHSSTITPIYHRDVKSSNILIDENYNAKIADFGLSKLVSLDKSKHSTTVQGTFGYIDPDYFHTGKLTEKSDVYSFGVVLLELLSGRKPIWPDPSPEYCDLVTCFMSCVRNDNMVTMFEERFIMEGNLEELQAVADIARRCLREKSQERPIMREKGASAELMTSLKIKGSSSIKKGRVDPEIPSPGGQQGMSFVGSHVHNAFTLYILRHHHIIRSR